MSATVVSRDAKKLEGIVNLAKGIDEEFFGTDIIPIDLETGFLATFRLLIAIDTASIIEMSFESTI